MVGLYALSSGVITNDGSVSKRFGLLLYLTVKERTECLAPIFVASAVPQLSFSETKSLVHEIHTDCASSAERLLQETTRT